MAVEKVGNIRGPGGRGINSIVHSGTSSDHVTYTVTYDDDSQTSFTVPLVPGGEGGSNADTIIVGDEGVFASAALPGMTADSIYFNRPTNEFVAYRTRANSPNRTLGLGRDYVGTSPPTPLAQYMEDNPGVFSTRIANDGSGYILDMTASTYAVNGIVLQAVREDEMPEGGYTVFAQVAPANFQDAYVEGLYAQLYVRLELTGYPVLLYPLSSITDIVKPMVIDSQYVTYPIAEVTAELFDKVDEWLAIQGITSASPPEIGVCVQPMQAVVDGSQINIDSYAATWQVPIAEVGYYLEPVVPGGLLTAPQAAQLAALKNQFPPNRKVAIQGEDGIAFYRLTYDDPNQQFTVSDWAELGGASFTYDPANQNGVVRVNEDGIYTLSLEGPTVNLADFDATYHYFEVILQYNTGANYTALQVVLQPTVQYDEGGSGTAGLLFRGLITARLTQGDHFDVLLHYRTRNDFTGTPPPIEAAFDMRLLQDVALR